MSFTPYPPFETRVVRVRRLSPGFARVTLSGEALRHYADHGWDQRIKIILELPGGGYGDFGILDTPAPSLREWFGRWRELPAEQRNVIRTFTASGIRPQDHEIDIDFALHDPAGPACRWALQAQPGDKLIIIGPDARAEDSTGGIDFQPGAATQVLLAADETAFPAVRNILAQLDPGVQLTVFAEAAHHEDLALLESVHPAHQVHPVLRSGPVGERLLEALGQWLAGAGEPFATAPEGASYAWLAGESGFVKLARRTLVRAHQMPTTAISFSGYWKQGQAEN